jgi:Flagellar hook-length control protein FliK
MPAAVISNTLDGLNNDPSRPVRRASSSTDEHSNININKKNDLDFSQVLLKGNESNPMSEPEFPWAASAPDSDMGAGGMGAGAVSVFFETAALISETDSEVAHQEPFPGENTQMAREHNKEEVITLSLQPNVYSPRHTRDALSIDRDVSLSSNSKRLPSAITFQSVTDINNLEVAFSTKSLVPSDVREYVSTQETTHFDQLSHDPLLPQKAALIRERQYLFAPVTGIDFERDEPLIGNVAKSWASPANVNSSLSTEQGVFGPSRASEFEWAPVLVDQRADKLGGQLVQVLGERVTLQIRQHVNQAYIRLDPPDLGKLDISVDVDGEHLSVTIGVASSAVREALLQTADQLRQQLMTQHQGAVEVNVNSGGESSSQHQEDRDRETHIGLNHQQQDETKEDELSTGWLDTLV